MWVTPLTVPVAVLTTAVVVVSTTVTAVVQPWVNKIRNISKIFI